MKQRKITDFGMNVQTLIQVRRQSLELLAAIDAEDLDAAGNIIPVLRDAIWQSEQYQPLTVEETATQTPNPYVGLEEKQLLEVA